MRFSANQVVGRRLKEEKIVGVMILLRKIITCLRHSEKWREDARFALVIGRTLRVLKITGASRK